MSRKSSGVRVVLGFALLPLVGCTLLYAPSYDDPAPNDAADAPDAEPDAARGPTAASDAAAPSSAPDTGAPAACRDDIVAELAVLGNGACGGPSLPISMRRGLAFQVAGYNVGGCIIADFGVPVPAVELVATVETSGPCGDCSPDVCSSSSMDVYVWRTSPEDAVVAQRFDTVGTSVVPFVVPLPFEAAKIAVCVARAGSALRVSSLRPVCR